ncbi:MAG: hypothetical protein KDB03_01170 [Planctomycetales bacterium]|nr:hypothetical protein [Planctomycetales bacterium]
MNCVKLQKQYVLAPFSFQPMWGVLCIAALLCCMLHMEIGGKEPSETSSGEASSLQRLSWLTGTWVFEKDGQTTQEHWRPVQGTMLLGLSHTFDAKRTSFFEYLRIHQREDALYYIASPAGRVGVEFRLHEMGDEYVEFRNGQHDYPQRIRYAKTGEGITAEISLKDGTRAQRFEFMRVAP